MPVTITLAEDDAERAVHLAAMIVLADEALTASTGAALEADGATERTAQVAEAARHQRERDACARELGTLIAPHLAAA